MLVCPVRGCRMELKREERRVVCERGHSFDIARSGYINLLQSQERRSKIPGDTAAAVAARRGLHDRGVTEPLLDGIAEALQASATDAVLDAGCGEGFYLGTLASRFGFRGHGIDISTKAVDAAVRRYPDCEWVVGNADRSVPYSDGSVSCVMSITGRMNAAEFRRIVRDGGRLVVAVAAPDDLTELRGAGRDRVAQTIETFAKGFRLVDQRRVTTVAELDAAGVQAVLDAIYRPRRPRPVEAMKLTFSLDVLVFQAE